jgi:hypothetical protein
VEGRFDPFFSLFDPDFIVLPVDPARRLNGKKKKRRDVGDFGGYVCKSEGNETGFEG